MWRRILLILTLGAAGGAVDAGKHIVTDNPLIDTLIAVTVTSLAAAINTKKKEVNEPKEKE